MKHKPKTLALGIFVGVAVMAIGTTALAAGGQISFNKVDLFANDQQISHIEENMTLESGASVPSSITYTDENRGDTTYIPIRKTGEALGTEVTWDGNAHKVSLETKVEGAGYNRAEDAAESYINALSQGNFDEMLSTFAVESYVDGYDFQAYIERIRLYQFATELPLPSTDSQLARAINCAKRIAGITNSLFFQLDYLLTDGQLSNDGNPTVLQDPNPTPDVFASQLTSKMEIDRLETLQFVEFLDPAQLVPNYNSELNRLNMEKQAALYGADDFKSVVAKVELEGSEYLFCFQAFQYGDRWYLSQHGGTMGILLNISVLQGGVTSMEDLYAQAASPEDN